MPQITLTEEQSRVLTQALEPVEVLDTNGNLLTRIAPLVTAADIAEAKRRLASKQRRFTAEQVRAHFQALEEAVAREELDQAQVLALLKRLQDETPR